VRRDDSESKKIKKTIKKSPPPKKKKRTKPYLVWLRRGVLRERLERAEAVGDLGPEEVRVGPERLERPLPQRGGRLLQQGEQPGGALEGRRNGGHFSFFFFFFFCTGKFFFFFFDVLISEVLPQSLLIDS
jgi:hypothetical protein